MKTYNFKIGDYITVADPADPSHFKRFHKIVGLLPASEGFIPYSAKSLQTGLTSDAKALNEYVYSLKVSLHPYQYVPTIHVTMDDTNLEAFERLYRVLTEQEKLIYINE